MMNLPMTPVTPVAPTRRVLSQAGVDFLTGFLGPQVAERLRDRIACGAAGDGVTNPTTTPTSPARLTTRGLAVMIGLGMDEDEARQWQERINAQATELIGPGSIAGAGASRKGLWSDQDRRAAQAAYMREYRARKRAARGEEGSSSA